MRTRSTTLSTRTTLPRIALILIGAIAFIATAQHADAQCPRVEFAKLLASDGAQEDWFGISVSISGDLALIGAELDDDNGKNSGSAYLFRFDPDGSGDWIEEAKLLASDGTLGDSFGRSVSFDRRPAEVSDHERVSQFLRRPLR